jgi:hypothetical protein
MIATRRIDQAAQRVPRRAAPVLEKIVAKRPRAKEGGGREEENRPGISSRLAGRLRNTNQWSANKSCWRPAGSTRVRGLSSVRASIDVTAHVETAAAWRFTMFAVFKLNCTV